MFYIGIDVGGTSIKAGLVDENGLILYKNSKQITNKDSESLVQIMVDLCNDILKSTNTNISDIAQIGCGIPGACDTENGIIISTTNLGFESFNLSEALNKHFNKPVFIENDASCAALGESISGATKSVKNSITITLGTGIGGGIIIDNRIYSGFNHIAGELGHIVIEMNGKKCNCGRFGCFEAYASAIALVNMTKELAENGNKTILSLCENDIAQINGKTIFDAIKLGDTDAKAVFDKYIEYLGTGIVNIINTFQPEMLVIGGGISSQGDALLNPLREYVSRYEFCSKVEQTKIIPAILGNDAGIIGAAMLGA